MTQRPENENLHRGARAFVISTLRMLSSLLQAGEKIPHVTRERFEFYGYGDYSYGPVSRPDYYVFLERHRKEIENLPEYAACKQLMASDPVVSKLETTTSKQDSNRGFVR